MISIVVNGEAIRLPNGASLKDLYTQLELDAKWVVAERNGSPVERALVASLILSEGDSIELVKAVAGG